MSLNPADNNLDKIDPELKEFIVNEQIKNQIQAQIRKFNNFCFERCVEKPGSLDEDQTFLLIRFPRESVERSKSSGNPLVGSVLVYEDGRIEFQDNKSQTVYSLMTNTPPKKGGSSQRKENHTVASEESDLFRLSLQRDEALHLGKVKSSTLLAVPKADETGVYTVLS